MENTTCSLPFLEVNTVQKSAARDSAQAEMQVCVRGGGGGYSTSELAQAANAVCFRLEGGESVALCAGGLKLFISKEGGKTRPRRDGPQKNRRGGSSTSVPPP
ncbi:UNVERIFIED_CONTAM: hypothetical protein K2H54_041635 [Gekko kuhli]